MVGRGIEWRQAQRKHIISRFKRHALLAPEAPLLCVLLLIGWAYHFPVFIGLLIMLTLAYFVVRLFLITSAAHELDQANYDQADSFSRAALRIYPWSPDALALRAQSRLLQGDDGAAEALLHQAHRHTPDDSATSSSLATLMLARGDWEGGRAHMRQDQTPADASYAAQPLAWIALHVDDDPEQAQRIIGDQDLARLAPAQAAPLLVLLAETQIAGAASFAARETIRRIETLLPRCSRPQQAELCYHLGRLHTMLDEDSGGFFRKSVNLDPNGRWAHAAWRSAVDDQQSGFSSQQPAIGGRQTADGS